MQNKKEIISYLDNISLFLLGILFIALPLMVTTITTDPFTLPKQVILAVIVFVLMAAFGVKMVLEKGIKIRRTPFDVPVISLGAVVLASSLFAVNRIDSITASITFLIAVFSYFVITNTVKDKKSVMFLMSALLAGAVLVSLSSVFSFFKIYALPFKETQFQAFSTLGSLLDQAIYLAFLLPVAAYPIAKFIKKKVRLNPQEIGFSVAGIIILVGLSISIYQLMTTQRPIMLPLQSGFQTAFAAISQDNGRVAQGFFLGSGYGTFGTDFTRFKQPTFNLNPDLWSFTFYRSSSFILELLATTGILGLLAFLALVYRVVKERPFFAPLVLAIITAFMLPFSYIVLAFFFILLGMFAAIQGTKTNDRFFDIELQLVALKKGLIAFEMPQIGQVTQSTETSEKSKILPFGFMLVTLAFIGFLGYYAVGYVSANLSFQKSLVAASKNNGSEAYQAQSSAIEKFKYSDAYYRVFSQTNLALANSLASQVPQGATPSAETQQTIYTLIQQSINAARNAATIAPQTSANWQNLSSIYRSLIGFGQDAEQFAVLTAQQAVVLDPNNPQLYINLGGIYYQIGDWDKASNQFQLAINLKPDYSNAYYNLGHALEQKQDLRGALAQYQVVKSLVANDKENLKRIEEEIKVLEQKVGQQQPTAGPKNPSDQPENLQVNEPSAQLPKQDPPVKIPEPQVRVTPVPSETPASTPAAEL
ncbi:tetratricopeptide repeat protein [Patescibacteria group bacterium]|nr:tetratricopeptide repeat protein [Patescibacteria group bacterium]